MKRIWILLALGLGACAIEQPVAVIGDRGDVLTGIVHADLAVGRFDVSNEALNCTGRYNQMSMERTISFTLTCSDGRRGFGSATRDSSGLTGQGTVRLSDGEKADFLFGPEAGAMRPAVGRR